MKKGVIRLVSMLLCLLSVCLFACADGEITAIEPKDGDIVIALGASVDPKEWVTVAGKGTLFYTVETPDILAYDGSLVTANKEGTGYLTVYSGSVSCRLVVRVVDGMRITASLKDASCVYDGEAKFLSATGNFPEGTEIRYFCNGEIFEGATDPGVYEIELEVLPPDGYYVEYSSKKARLTVERITIDMSGVSFPSAIYTYDGTEKRLAVTGEPPEQTTLRLENHIGTDAGVYLAKAYFDVDERYYNPITPLTARLTVLKADFEVDYSGFYDMRRVYDGQEHFPVLDTPAGLRAELYVFDISVKEIEKTDEDGNTIKVPVQGAYVTKDEYFRSHAADRPFVKSGSYRVKAVFETAEELLKNYNAVPDREITVTIAKADFSHDLQWKKTSGSGGDFVYDGSVFTVGWSEEDGAYDGGLIGSLPTGVNGEFASGVGVTFILKGAQGATAEFSDAGSYTVTARFTMPDGWTENYNALEDMKYTYIVEKAKYEAEFVFDGKETGGDKDFSSPVEFDGRTHYFALRFPTAADEADFAEDVEVKYYIVRNGGEKIYFQDAAGIVDAGSYTVGYELKFSSDALKKNYLLPADGFFRATINPVVFDMTETAFPSSLNNVYDGTPRYLEVTGLPDGVAVSYDGNGRTEVGEYIVKATFSVTGVSPVNYILRGENGAVSSMQAKLVISKARYEEGDLPLYSAEGGVYSPTKTLADYPITGGGAEVRWASPGTVPTCDVRAYTAIYNADGKNYYDYSFALRLEITPLEYDGSLLSCEEQFLPYTGKRAAPVLLYGGERASAFDLEYTCETDATNYGKHSLSGVTARLKDEVNCAVKDAPDFGEINIYIYNADLFRYEGLRLNEYLGIEREVEVPEGTRSIYSRAFAGSPVTVLTLPDTIVSLSSSALSGMSALAELTLPFTGTSSDARGALGAIFGEGNASLPSSLVKVTVTGETNIPASAFKDAVNLKEIVFTRSVDTMGASAFEGCKALLAADFPVLESMGEYAFRYCFGLKSLTLPFIGASPADLRAAAYLLGTDAGENAYSNYSLSVIDLSGGSFAALPADAFRSLVSAERIILPGTLRSVPYGAFYGVGAEFNLNESFTSVTSGLYYGYKGVTAVLPSSVTRIEREAFRDASNIETISLPSGVNYIGEYAFRGFKGRVLFEGSALTRIETRAFALYGGEYAPLPSSVREIGDYAFEGSKIKGIVIDGTTRLDGDGIFKDCAVLASAEVENGALPYKLFSGCSALNRVNLSGVAEVESFAFENCARLLEIAFPESLAAVGGSAFAGCSTLSLVSFKSSVPPTFASGAFPSAQRINLYVPEAGLLSYKEALASYNNLTVLKSA